MKVTKKYIAQVCDDHIPRLKYDEKALRNVVNYFNGETSKNLSVTEQSIVDLYRRTTCTSFIDSILKEACWIS